MTVRTNYYCEQHNVCLIYNILPLPNNKQIKVPQNNI